MWLPILSAKRHDHVAICDIIDSVANG